MIKSIAIAIDPEQYALRHAEFSAEKATWSKLLPIFYYNDPLYPGNTVSEYSSYSIFLLRQVLSCRKYIIAAPIRAAI
jgi:hypothetical protein